MTDQPVNNGKRIDVMLGDFSGTAGFVERDGKAQLAYQPNKGGDCAVGAIITADDRRWRVTKAGRSDFANHLKLLDLVPLA
jgi:hypothetical protein